MLSRRHRVQERKANRNGVLLLLLSGILLIVMFFYGLPFLARFATIVNDFKSSSNPVVADDKTPPTPPQLIDLPSQAVAEQEVTLSGRGESGSIVKIFRNEKEIKELVVDESSTFQFSLKLDEGENRIKLTAQDQAGNFTDFLEVYKIYYDTKAPEIEITKPQDGQSFFGVDKNIAIEGKTEKDAQLTINDRMVIISIDGSFSQKVKLEEGENELLIVVQDQAGNKTEKTIKVNFTP